MEAQVLTARQFRVLASLLGAIAALLLILIAGLAAGAIYGAHALHALAGAPPAQAVDELAQRQQSFDRELSGVGQRTLKESDDLARRREGLSDASGGLLKKFDTTIRLNQLMADELLVLLHNLAGTEVSVAHGARPLPAERQARRPSETRRSPPPARK